MTKDERIKHELDKLNQIYRDLPEQTYKVMEPLIENAAFMKVTLEDLAEEIQRTGAVETYQNGANQNGRKQAAALQAYDRIIKDYNAVMKTLSAKLPTVVKEYVVQKPFEPTEKTPEELETERKREIRRNLKCEIELTEAHLWQLDGWKRDGKLSAENYEIKTKEGRDKIKQLKERLQALEE